MYSQEAIDVLINRIGWSEISSDLPFGLTTENRTADSGKKFNFYHSMVTVDNIYYAVPDADIEETDFNDFLKDVREQSVLNILASILDEHTDYDPLTDYSNIIIDRATLFDKAIGYSVATKMIELFISTERSNFRERNAKMAYNTLKIELEGAKNDNGHFVAKGLLYHLETSIKKVQKVIFPFKVIVQDGNAW